MKRKLLKFIVPVLILLTVIAGMIYTQTSRCTPIDEWSAQLTADKIDWIQTAREYGVDKLSYSIPEEEYEELIPLLETVTEDNSTRQLPQDAERNGYRLALQYDGKLWLFHCRTNGMVSLTFADAETGAIYGCEGALLYIHSPELWDYIVNTVDLKAT